MLPDDVFQDEIEQILQLDIENAIKNENITEGKATIDLTVEQPSPPEPLISQCLLNSTINSHVDVVKELASKLNQYEQFFIVARRNAPLPHILKLWQRQASKSQVTN